MSGSNENGAMRLRPLLAAALSGVLLAACGGGTGDPPAPPAPAPAPAPTPPAPATPFKAMPARLNLEVGGQGTLALIGASGALTWTSSDPAIAGVDAMGVVTARARGAATITVTNGARTSTATVKVWQTAGANADASSESLIAAALAAGSISAEQALLYRVYARYGDERLPAPYEGPSDPQGSIPMRAVAAQMPALSQATQDLLQPFFIPPIYAESWYGQQLGLTATQATAQAAMAHRVHAAAAAPPVCSMDVANALIQAGLLVRRTTAHYNLYAFVSQFGHEAAMLDYAASVIELIDASLRNLLQRAPKSDAAEACNGGDGALDIYLVDLGVPGEYGETKGYGRCENTPAFIKVDKFKLDRWFTIEPAFGQKLLRTVLAHEVMHTHQFGMDRSAACSDYDWIDEATAQWAPDHVFPGDNEEDGFEKLGGANALRTGKLYVDYLKGGHRESIEQGNGYTRYIYFQFMARKYGAASIKALFDAWTSHGSVDSLEVALKAVGSSLRDAWPEFGKALWNDVRENVLTDLRGWDGYDYGKANVAPSNPIALAAGRATVTLLAEHGGSLRPRSLGYERLVFPDEVSPVMLTNPLGALPQSRHLRLTAVKRIGGQWQPPEDWTGEITKFFCRDKQAERVQELVLIVSNSDPDPNAAPVSLSTMPPFELSVSNVGCWKWQGQATLQFIGDDGNVSTDVTVRATDLVFDPPADFQGGPMMLTVASGMASGLFTTRSVVPPCTTTITGPTTAIVSGDVGTIGFNLDVKDLLSQPPDRKVGLLQGVKFIDSTQVAVCNGQTTVTPAPSTGWAWLNFPTPTNPLDVASDGKTIEANVTIVVPPTGRTIHNFKFTAMRE